MQLDPEKVTELKNEMDKRGKDLSKVLDIHLSSNSPGFNSLHTMITDFFYISGSTVYNMWTKLEDKTSSEDFVFRSLDQVEEFKNFFTNASAAVEPMPDDPTKITKSVLYVGKRHLTILFPPLFQKINFIFYPYTSEYLREFGNIVDTKNPPYFNQAFDFMHTCAMYDLKAKVLIIPDQTTDTYGHKELRINPRISQHVAEFMLEQEKLGPPKQVLTLDETAKYTYIEKLFERYNKFLGRGMTPNPPTEIFFRKLQVFIEERTGNKKP